MAHIRIVLADDHKLVRQGVRSLLEAQPGFEVIGEASDGQEAYKLIESLSPDIAFLDVMMPNLNGIETAKLVHQRALKTRIIFLSMHANATYAVRALQSGALGYVLKDSDFTEVLNAVEHVLEGRRYLSTAIADEVLEMLLSAEAGKDESLDLLSPREREILQLVAEGNSNATIAEKLSLSVRTVESHRLNLTKKLRITSHADLVKFAINQGLITS
ncbi:MAG TPA: response regulator transcription factor [Anaerolineales bacterium]|nr:response regulator transcription factor [Anaerolineales bacterium]HMX20348.1 response regulator transcription factor [Anaerolineales bacterium]HMX75315.1 response regulator transcription factor [Anaerolineales bacterium]HMZ44229.1 response regulator transcription factor [Anaerolineales bacterium]HNA55578.1 response regulator transcription factor [Anaerolineales bacterium]